MDNRPPQNKELRMRQGALTYHRNETLEHERSCDISELALFIPEGFGKPRSSPKIFFAKRRQRDPDRELRTCELAEGFADLDRTLVDEEVLGCLLTFLFWHVDVYVRYVYTSCQENSYENSRSFCYSQATNFIDKNL